MTAGTGDARLMNRQQPYTSPTTHAGVQAISICGWSKICSDVYGSGDVHAISICGWSKLCSDVYGYGDVHAISICGWSKICSDVYGSGDVHVVVYLLM